MKTNTMERPKRTQLNIEMEPEQHRALKIIAASEGKTLRELAGDILVKFATSTFDKKGIQRPFELPATPFKSKAATMALLPLKNDCGVQPNENDGGLAQLVERLHGMQKVSGSTPLVSTIPANENALAVVKPKLTTVADNGLREVSGNGKVKEGNAGSSTSARGSL